ncbi:expressed unknown protein [Seminavis robusta]|uniref:Uncharacterized protein n=1 Tax=Seminavis robusta TaxID=568900 RepID=A0A9N8HTS4_9STRA|nr:expressed unknown protein [Seminavis robusta]|eukprot:Sro1638_g287760.1 n/a (118) ;mRNA; r:11959-12312
MSEIRDAESSSKEGRDSMSFAQLMELRERESTPTDPSRWSISYEQLLEIDNLVRKKSRFRGVPSAMTMRDVNETIIVPRCRATKTSYAASLNPKGLEMDSFVSHCWCVRTALLLYAY